jgi:ketosteroid isomerase-like protein
VVVILRWRAKVTLRGFVRADNNPGGALLSSDFCTAFLLNSTTPNNFFWAIIASLIAPSSVSISPPHHFLLSLLAGFRYRFPILPRGAFMQTLRIAAIVLLSVTSALAQTSSKMPAPEKEAVISTLTAMWDALEHADIDRYASYIHPNFTSFGEDDTYLNSGKDYEVRSYTNYLKHAKNLHTDMHQPEVTIRGDVAWITYYWTESADVDGKHVSSRGKSTRIFVKENGKWLCIHGHYTYAPSAQSSIN